MPTGRSVEINEELQASASVRAPEVRAGAYPSPPLHRCQSNGRARTCSCSAAFREAEQALPSFRDARARAEAHERALADLPGLYRRAVERRDQGRWDEALTLFREVQATTLGWEECDRHIQELEGRAAEADAAYHAARQAEDQGRLRDAIDGYRRSEAAYPRYRDVPDRIAHLERRKS